ncbi:hypothetical protein BDZ97DRAFT_1758372 [Flammula alnicola]|nr:hypothetical protein BDZ97DRAFT_1758372 [Flammula alnicola]
MAKSREMNIPEKRYEQNTHDFDFVEAALLAVGVALPDEDINVVENCVTTGPLVVVVVGKVGVDVVGVVCTTGVVVLGAFVVVDGVVVVVVVEDEEPPVLEDGVVVVGGITAVVVGGAAVLDGVVEDEEGADGVDEGPEL